MSGQLTILLVDDDSSYCFLLARLLEVHGLRVIIANDGATALELAEEADIALVDMIMPGLSGIETIPLLLSANPTVKVIACSGSEAHLFHDDLHSLGIEHFLSKPFAVESLLAEIDQLLTAPAA